MSIYTEEATRAEKLEAELSVMRLQLAMARDVLRSVCERGVWPDRISTYEALASIDDAKLLDGLVLCDAEPHTRIEYIDDNGMLHSVMLPEPLYARSNK